MTWTKASFCSVGACVEVQRNSTRVWIRDSKQSELGGFPIISILDADFEVFTSEVLASSQSGQTTALAWRVDGTTGRVLLSSRQPVVTLVFNRREWGAFLKGLASGNFAQRRRALAA